MRAAETRRLSSVDPAPLREIDIWRELYRRFRTRRMDALDTEIARGSGSAGSEAMAGSRPGKKARRNKARVPDAGCPENRRRICQTRGESSVV
ncbi:hypothetical protein Acsp03_60210 [Actinomadura sp. NBRC 104412]|nr:hypothetical protein Acsp03_60210 [Actinomadura sp. NBRC 104412]